MKLNFIAITLAVTAFTSMTASTAYASAGTVKFTGEIIDVACTVDISSQDQTVSLGSYSKSEFANAGDITAATKFSIVLKSCPEAVTTAHVRFDGKPDAADSTLLAVDSTVDGAATGVAINLMSADKVQLPLHGDNDYRYPLSNTDDNTLDFYAQYKSTSATVTVGPANSVANFSVAYN